MPHFICDGEKYEVGGKTIGFPVTFQGLPEKIEVEGYELLLKDAFHVSLVCTGKIIEKYAVEDPDFTDKVIADFCNFVKHTPIELAGFRDEFRFVAENERRTVAVMCDMSNLDMFFDHLNKKYELNVEYPPTHVTLYTLQPNTGIFLTDSSDIANLTKSIPNPLGFQL